MQVIQSPIPNSNGYVGPYLMSGNIAVQNQNGQIQLIAGAKPIQSNQPLQPMFAQSKQLIQGQAGDIFILLLYLFFPYSIAVDTLSID